MTNDDETIAKTLWSETILEILYSVLKQDKSDAQIDEILVEVKQKGFKSSYIIEKVEQKVWRQASLRVRKLLGK